MKLVRICFCCLTWHVLLAADSCIYSKLVKNTSFKQIACNDDLKGYSFLVAKQFDLKHLEGNTLPETNSLHLKMDGSKISFLLGWLPGRCELLVSGRISHFQTFLLLAPLQVLFASILL